MQYVMQCIDYSTNYSESRCLMQQVIIIRAVAFWSRFSSCWSRYSKTLDFQQKVDFLQAVLSYLKSASWSMRRKPKNRNLLIICYFYKTKVNKSVWIMFLYLKL